MNVLVIASHPDDEVLGCGGTMARLAADGAAVHVLILATGMTSRAGFDPERDAPALAIHRDRAHRAGALLGAREVRLQGLPDQKLDTLPLLEITRVIEEEIHRVRPEWVFTQHGGDLNLDHAITFRATLTATRPMAGGIVRHLYSYEVPSSSEWAFGQFDPRFQPSVFFDITAHLETKLAAMAIYESETRPSPHPRSLDAIRALARLRGASAGFTAAEAFHCVRCLI
jgi:LmbE family N-acetylglucosaminyl deacetylase